VRFNLVAQKYSEDKAKDGGLLGWKRREELNGTFADVAFKLGKGKASAQVLLQTQCCCVCVLTRCRGADDAATD
jgi:parvulin-like peptidyl-prolyl isomerase